MHHQKETPNPWMDPPTVRHGPTYQHPSVKILLSLATYFVHKPHGQLAEQFRKYHTYTAKTIFETLLNSSSHWQTTDDSSELDTYPTPSNTYKWEDISTTSQDPKIDKLASQPPSPPLPSIEFLSLFTSGFPSEPEKQ